MAFNRLEADREDVGNLLVSMPLGDQLDDGFLARGKRVIEGSAGFSEKGREQRLRNPSGEEGLVFYQRLHGRDDVFLSVCLQEISQRAGFEHAPDQDLLFVHRKYENFGAWFSLANLPGCLDSAQEGERIVDYGDIRFCL